MADLTGLRIINTRPTVRASALSEALSQHGATVLALPLLETIPIALSATAQGYVQNLDRYDMVFVVSPTAAELGLQALADYWPQWPIDMLWLAVGESTAQVLRTYMIDPLVPAQETSEGLLQLPQLQQLQQGQRLLVLRGEGGRNLVRDSLQTQGIPVDYIDLYRRQLPTASAQQWHDLQPQAPHIAFISSGESLEQWLNMAGQQAQKMPVLVISPRLAALAQQKGFQTVLSSASIKTHDIIATLCQWYNAQAHGINA